MEIIKKQYFKLFIASFLALYFEMICIRWIAVEVRVMAFFTNTILIASFLGLGSGMALRSRRNWSRLFTTFNLGLTALIVGLYRLYVGKILAPLPSDSGEFVWSVSGDGGLGQYLAELTTLVKYNMPVKHILINNSELGKISKEQRTSELEVWKTDIHNPDFARFASNCGALGIRVEKREELETAMQKIKNHDGPALLDIVCDVNLI